MVSPVHKGSADFMCPSAKCWRDRHQDRLCPMNLPYEGIGTCITILIFPVSLNFICCCVVFYIGLYGA